MDKKEFLKSYFNNLKQLINFEDDTISKIIQTCDLLLESKKKWKEKFNFWERRKRCNRKPLQCGSYKECKSKMHKL